MNKKLTFLKKNVFFVIAFNDFMRREKVAELSLHEENLKI